MFAFMHPYQTIHRLEQELAALNAQLEAEKAPPLSRDQLDDAG